MRNSIRTALIMTGALMACAAWGGCASHGAYTREGKAQAQDRMNVLKSATDWGMARQEFLAGDLDKALKTVDQSIALNPNVTKSHVLRGRIMLEKSRLEEARAEFLEAERLDASNVDAQYYLGIVHERVSEPEEAVARYRNAMTLDTGNAQYVVAAAEMLIVQGKLDEAEQLLNERKRFFQYNSAIRQTLGHIELLRDEPQKAAEFFHEAMLLAPGDQAIMEDLTEAQMSCGQVADAEAMLAKMLDAETNKDRRDLKSMRARCLVQLNRHVEARELLRDLTSDRDGAADLRAWIDLGNVCAVLHDQAGLRTSMNRVLAIAPERGEGFMLRALYYRQDNRLDDALLAADQAIAKSRGDATPYVFKALVLQDMGRLEAAHTAALQALHVDESSTQAARLLKTLERTTFAGAEVEP